MSIVKRRAIAAAELFLVFPATLFMTALFVRDIQAEPYEPAHSARRVVEWFVARPFLGHDISLIALPFTAFLVGGATLLRAWRNDGLFRQSALGVFAMARQHAAALIIAGATVAAGGVLGIVAIHVIGS